MITGVLTSEELDFKQTGENLLILSCGKPEPVLIYGWPLYVFFFCFAFAL